MAESLKIGLVLDDSLDKPDGVQQYVLSIGQWLTSQGHEVHYLVGKTTRLDIMNVHSLSRNVNVSSNGNRMSIPLPTSRRRLRTFLAAERFDVLHVQVPYSPWLAHRLILAAPAGTAVIGTFHIVAYSRLIRFGTKLLAVWVRRSLRRFSDMVSVSSAAARYAEQTYGITTEILPNVLDYSRFHDAEPRLPKSENLKILFLGRLVERKGCRYLLEAVNNLRQDSTLPDFEVIICGKGPLRQSLEAYVSSNNLQKAVRFTGFVAEADKPGYYASADIAVFPSTGGESFGIVLVEAMASGSAAVIGASNSGYASVLQPRQDLLFDPADVSSLAAKLSYFLKDKAARISAADWGETYSQRFDIHLVGPQLVARYETILRNRANR